METTFALSTTGSVELAGDVVRRSGEHPMEVALADVVKLRYAIFRGDGWCELHTRSGKLLRFSTNRRAFRFDAIGGAAHLGQFNTLVEALRSALAPRSDVKIVVGDWGLAALNLVITVFFAWFTVARIRMAPTVALLGLVLCVLFFRWALRRIPRRFRGISLPRV